MSGVGSIHCCKSNKMPLSDVVISLYHGIGSGSRLETHVIHFGARAKTSLWERALHEEEGGGKGTAVLSSEGMVRYC